MYSLFLIWISLIISNILFPWQDLTVLNLGFFSYSLQACGVICIGRDSTSQKGLASSLTHAVILTWHASSSSTQLNYHTLCLIFLTLPLIPSSLPMSPHSTVEPPWTWLPLFMHASVMSSRPLAWCGHCLHGETQQEAICPPTPILLSFFLVSHRLCFSAFHRRHLLLVFCSYTQMCTLVNICVIQRALQDMASMATIWNTESRLYL